MEKSLEQCKSVPMTLIEFEQCCKISLSLQQASMQSRKDFPKFGLPRYRCNATNTAHVYRSGIMPYTKVVPVQRVLPARMVSDGDHRSSRREDRPGTACTAFDTAQLSGGPTGKEPGPRGKTEATLHLLRSTVLIEPGYAFRWGSATVAP